jgi:hypothetical protein
MKASALPQRYANASQFFAVHRLTHPATEYWRLCERHLGEIVGLPGSRGILECTNGILCYISQENGNLFLGHVQWFEADSGESGEEIVERSDAKRRKPQIERKPSRLETEYADI